MQTLSSDMSQRPQLSEITQRRQFCTRINELKSSCEELAERRDDLYKRLCELNTIVDKLKAGEKDPDLRVGSTSHQSGDQFFQNSQKSQREPPISYSKTTRDLTSKYGFSSHHHDQYFRRKSASDAFKIKLSYCLQEILPKANEIVELAGQVRDSNFGK